MFAKIATIETVEKYRYRLTLYRDGKAVFVKTYNSFRSAKSAQTRLIRKYCY